MGIVCLCAVVLFADNLEKVRALEMISRRVQAMGSGFESSMKITEVSIRPANEEFVKAYASICLDDYFLIHDIRIIKGPAGLFISFPTVTQSDGTQRDIAFPVNAETRTMIEQAVLAEYEKVVGEADQSEKK